MGSSSLQESYGNILRKTVRDTEKFKQEYYKKARLKSPEQAVHGSTGKF
jgi:hypothetical protein